MTDFAKDALAIAADLGRLGAGDPIPAELIQRLEFCLAVLLVIVTQTEPRWTPPEFVQQSGRLQRALAVIPADQMPRLRAWPVDAVTHAAYRDLVVKFCHALDAAQSQAMPQPN